MRIYAARNSQHNRRERDAQGAKSGLRGVSKILMYWKNKCEN